MTYTQFYRSPLGELLLSADEVGLTGIWFDGGKYYANGLSSDCEEKSTPVLEKTSEWLNIYFDGKEPDFTPPLHPTGSDFRMQVWKFLLEIPYGKTVTYGEIAKKVAIRRGIAHMSAQAIGGAVGHNNISIIIPCHRVVGSGGNLTGYAAGIEKKIFLLRLENADVDKYFVPQKGTAL